MSETQTSETLHSSAEIESLLTRVWPEDDFTEPVLGKKDDDIIAPNLASLLASPDTVISTVEKDGQLAGVSVAVPIGQFDSSRVSESAETAYVYYTAVDPTLQGGGLVAQVSKAMETQLRNQGYSYLEEDCVRENGYADTVSRVYGEAIVDWRDHTDYLEIGPQRFFRIDLSRIPESA